MKRKTSKLIFITLLSVIFITFNYQAKSQSDLAAAKNYSANEQFEKAEKIYNELISKEPNNGNLYFFLGENYLKNYFTDTLANTLVSVCSKAQKSFMKGIESDPTNPINFVGMGRISYYLGKTDEVQKNFSKALELLPPVKPKKCKNPEVYALNYMKIGETYGYEKKIDTAQALSNCRIALEYQPLNSEIYIIMGEVYNLVNNGTLAMANYNKAQALDVASPLAKMKQGYMYVRAGNPSAAVTQFEAAKVIDPNFAPVYLQLGEVWLAQGKLDIAAENYKKYLELSGNNTTAKVRYAISLYKAKNYKECIVQIGDIFKVDTTINFLNRIMAYSLYEEKKYQEALIYMDKFMNNSTPDKLITRDYIYYGRILGENKKIDMAVDVLKKAIELDPEKQVLYRDIAEIYINAKRNKEGIENYEKLTLSGKANLNDRYQLARAYYSEQLWGKADTAYQTFIQLQPTNQKAYIYRARCLVNQDLEWKTGLAKDAYETAITVLQTDSAKYINEFGESLYYIAYYNYKISKDYKISKKYCERIIALNSKNNFEEQAKALLNFPELKAVKP